MELATGTRIGPYEVQRRIGAGGMGVVYGAVDTRLGRSVAIKVLPAALLGDDERLRRFEKEARTIGALNHPNLVTLHDVGHHQGAPYLVTELLSGASLRSRLAAGRLAIRETIQIASDVARGLAAAHGAGVVHRDIKPDNLFITNDGRVKILDFGIAKLSRDTTNLGNADTLGSDASGSGTTATATGTGVVIGTPGYMAPEQLAGGEVDARTDLFALGVVMFEMLSGRRPFAADTHVEESYAILKLPPADLPSSVPVALGRVVSRCLEKRPDARFQAAADLAFALEALGDGTFTPSVAEARTELAGPTTAKSPPPAAAGSRVRARTLLAAAALLLVAVFGIAVILKITRGPSVTPVQQPARAAPWPDALAAGGATYRRVSYHSQRDWYARFTHDGRVLYSAQSGERWQIVESDPLRPAVRELSVEGRLLDIASTGQLAVLLDDDTLVTVAPGAGPRELVKHVAAASWAPDGKSLAVVRDVPGTGSVVEYPIGTVVRRHGHYGYSNVRVSRDGQYVAVVEHDALPDSRGRLLVLDATGNRVAQSIIYPGIEGVAWSPDGREVWFSEWTTMRALSLGQRDRVLFEALLPLHLRDVTRDGRILIAPSDVRFGTYSGPLAGDKQELGWFDAAVVQSLSRDGSVIAFLLGNGIDQQPDGYASYVRTGRTAPVPVGHAFRVALVPDASAVLLLTAKPGLRLVPLSAGPTRDLELGAIRDLDKRDVFFVTTDGKQAIVRGAAGDGAMRLWSIPLAGGPPQALGRAETDDLVRARYHPLSPDGKWIARGTRTGLRLVPTGDGAPVDLPVGDDLTPLQFTRDGKALIVQHGVSAQISRVELGPPVRRTPVTQLPIAGPTRWVEAAVSGDATTIAYSFPRTTSDLYVIEPPAPEPR